MSFRMPPLTNGGCCGTQDALTALRQLNNNPETFMKAQRPIVMFAWENALTLRKRNEAVSRQQTRHRQLHEQGETNAKGNAGTKRLNNGVFCGVMLSFPNGYRFLGLARLTAVCRVPCACFQTTVVATRNEDGPRARWAVTTGAVVVSIPPPCCACLLAAC